MPKQKKQKVFVSPVRRIFVQKRIKKILKRFHQKCDDSAYVKCDNDVCLYRFLKCLNEDLKTSVNSCDCFVAWFAPYEIVWIVNHFTSLGNILNNYWSTTYNYCDGVDEMIGLLMMLVRFVNDKLCVVDEYPCYIDDSEISISMTTDDALVGFVVSSESQLMLTALHSDIFCAPPEVCLPWRERIFDCNGEVVTGMYKFEKWANALRSVFTFVIDEQDRLYIEYSGAVVLTKLWVSVGVGGVVLVKNGSSTYVSNGRIIYYDEDRVFPIISSESGLRRDNHVEMSKTKCEWVPAPDDLTISDSIFKSNSKGNIFQTRITVARFLPGREDMAFNISWLLNGAARIQKKYYATVTMLSENASYIVLGNLKVNRVDIVTPLFVSAVKGLDQTFVCECDAEAIITLQSTVLIRRPLGQMEKQKSNSNGKKKNISRPYVNSGIQPKVRSVPQGQFKRKNFKRKNVSANAQNKNNNVNKRPTQSEYFVGENDII